CARYSNDYFDYW
nr:immunoglobulin heavy chain junction region [Mus musculus]